MLDFQLVVLDNAECTPEVIAALELSAFFRGESDLSDIPLDLDLAREHYIANLEDEDLKADYYAEPGIPDGLLFEEFRLGVEIAINSRMAALGDHYPFKQTTPGFLERKPLKEISVVGASYLVLQFYRALNANRIEILGNDEASISAKKKEFGREFANLFEYIAGYTVAGHLKGAPYMTSKARSAEKLHKILTNFCWRVQRGRVKGLGDFSEEQANTNDGKVDCFVQVGDLPLTGTASVYLVGASLQKQATDNKIMGSDKVSFVKDFFNVQPAVFRGALVRPQDEDELILDKCNRRDCALYSYDAIWQNMGKRKNGGHKNKNDEHQNRALRRLDQAARNHLEKFRSAIYQDDFESFSLDAA